MNLDDAASTTINSNASAEQLPDMKEMG